MNALDRSLAAHAADLIESWSNDTGWGDGENDDDIFLFQAEGFVLVIHPAGYANGWGWRISDEQSGFERARSKKHHPIDMVISEAWPALAELIRALKTGEGPIQ